MYKFMGRQLDIGDELLAEYEKLMYGPLEDTAIIWYLELEFKIDVKKNPKELAKFTDKELTEAIIKHMNNELDVMRS